MRSKALWGLGRAAGGLSLCLTMGLGAGCLSRPIGEVEPRTTYTATFNQLANRITKIDLLLVVDNSGSMADKQNILADAVPNLVKSLLAPPCIGADGQPIAQQPKPNELCPSGSAREFEPIQDVHIGVITSSLGDHTAGFCKDQPPTNDKGHLVVRSPTPGQDVPTYQGKGFLAWDPSQKQSPPGDGDLDVMGGKLRDLVVGAGQSGCGYEATLESWYRFLVDPKPHKFLGRSQDGKLVVSSKEDDQDLLDQRKDFLRPDSMVGILMLTDENDCSVKVAADALEMTDYNRPMTRARAECEKDINDPCCAPCGKDDPALKCPADLACEERPNLINDTSKGLLEDPNNLRCFNQKRRFGKDYLYPVERYIKGLSQAQVEARDGSMMENPLFPADKEGKGYRTPESKLVFMGGIVGVPWQDIARLNKDGKPDLVNGLDADGKAVGGFMTPSELSKRDATLGKSRWDIILGDPSNGVAPSDPFMREDRYPRDGQNPIIDDSIQGVDAGRNASVINGHEWNTDVNGNGDLQFACVFDLPAASGADCASKPGETKNPLCQNADGTYGSIQHRAKGYPGLRHLSVLKGIGSQAMVGSICPVQVDNVGGRDYGYNPAVATLVEQLKSKLIGQCLPQPIPANDKGQVACIAIEARKIDEGATCCDGLTARVPVDPNHTGLVDQFLETPAAKQVGYNCFCEIPQLEKEELKACQNDTAVVPTINGNPVNGWCYIEDSISSPVGSPELVESCASTEKQKLRFVGAGQTLDKATLVVSCYAER